MNTYTYAKLSEYDLLAFRIGGPGLGNLLFPWARAVVAARLNNWTPIWPTWPQLKVGPMLRGESDNRTYSDLFLASDDYIHGVDKLLLLSNPTLKKHSEGDVLPDASSSRRQLICYTGMNGLFEPILGQHQLVNEELMRITNKTVLLPEKKVDFIAVHIRFGDFASYDESKRKANNNMRLPLQWYVELIKQIDKKSKIKQPFIIFSDADDHEIQELLELENVERAEKTDALSDILKMSSANALIASNSTFSMWSAYLGRMPVIWHSSFNKSRLYFDKTEHEFYMGNDVVISDSLISSISGEL